MGCKMSLLQILQGTFRLSDTKTLQLPQLTLNAGDSWAFVGSNGSGKSALARALAGELPLLKGERQSQFSHITRLSFEQLQKLVSDEWQRNNTDMLGPGEDDTGRTTAEIIQDEVKDAPRCMQLAQQFGITALLDRRFKYLSTGETRKTLLCQALMSEPDLLILDEPTTGLDPQTRQLIWNVIEKLQKNENMTVFLTTHYMEEAANAGYVVILDKGSIAAEGTPFELKNDYVQDIVSVYGVSEDEIKSLNREYKKIRDGYQIKVRNTKEATKLIVEHQDLFTDYEVVKGGMDDVFLAVTGKKLGGEH